jgi:flagellar basal-body rod modification protein FlgD
MSEIAPAATDYLTGTPRPDAYSGLQTDEFIKIMFTELSNQDPFKPNDSAAMLEQINSIRQIQSDIDMGAKLESLVAQNQLAGASGLIGKLVSGVSESNDRVAGLVVSVSRTSKGPVLNLDDGSRVPFANVDELVDPAILEEEPTPETPPDNSDDEDNGEEVPS